MRRRVSQWGAMRFGFLLTFALVLLVACAPSGEDPRSRLDEITVDSGAYTLRYLSPPWELVSVSGETIRLRIESNAELLGVREGGVGKYELIAQVEAGTPPELAATEAREASRRGDLILAGPRAVFEGDAVRGTEVLYRDTAAMSRNARVVFLQLSALDASLRLAFDATPGLDTREVDAMIGQVSIGAP